MNSIWQMWARDVSPTTCNKIIQECEQLPPMEAGVGGQSVTTVDNKVRKSEIRWAGDIQWIKDLIYGYASTANRNAFGFDINYLARCAIHYIQRHRRRTSTTGTTIPFGQGKPHTTER